MTSTPPARTGGPPGSDNPLDHPIFDGVDRSKVTPLLAAVPVRRLGPGEAVGLPIGPRQLHLVLSGLLRCYRLATNERQILLELIPPGGFDGLVQMSGRPGHYTVAVEESTVISMGPDMLGRLFAADPQVPANLVWAAAHRLAIREQQIEAMSDHNLVTGVAGVLLMLADRHGVHDGRLTLLPDHLTHHAVAEMLGVRRETVTNSIGRLRRLGAVSRVRGRYSVDEAILAEVLGS
jgi:CRP/FNR family transcriptional regulator